MQLKVSQVKRIFDKLGMEVRPSDHIFAYFRHNGKLIIKTKISHGSGDAKAKDKISQDFKLIQL